MSAMTPDEANSRIAFLVAEINRHDRLYYVEDKPVIGDRDYDLLYEELRKLEKDYPQFRDPDSPTQRGASRRSARSPRRAFAAFAVHRGFCYNMRRWRKLYGYIKHNGELLY